MILNDSDCFTANMSICLFDIISAKLKKFDSGTRFKINKIETNYNAYYKTYTYHVRASVKSDDCICVFTCSRKENSNKITVHSGEINNAYLEWNNVFKEECPIECQKNTTKSFMQETL